MHFPTRKLEKTTVLDLWNRNNDELILEQNVYEHPFLLDLCFGHYCPQPLTYGVDKFT